MEQTSRGLSICSVPDGTSSSAAGEEAQRGQAATHMPADATQDAGGWSSPAMLLRYVEAAKIANEGVRLGS